jgi:predicted RNase H-like HicB family nuclease
LGAQPVITGPRRPASIASGLAVRDPVIHRRSYLSRCMLDARVKPGHEELDMRVAVVIEKANGNYSAYVPDLPGCVATGSTVAETEKEIGEAIRFHIEGLKEDGLPVPEPTSIADYVDA